MLSCRAKPTGRSRIHSSQAQDLTLEQQGGFWSGLDQLYRALPPRRRRQLYLVIALMLAGAVAELATIGAVLPFLSLLADPTRLDHVPGVAAVFRALGAVTNDQRLLAAGGLFVLIAVIAAAVRLQLTWSSQNFIFQLGHDLSVDIQRRLLLQPYAFHIGHNTSALLASLEKVGVLVFNVLLQLMQAASASIISIFIIAGLISIDPLMALSSAAAFALIYVLVSAITRRRLGSNSGTITYALDERIKIVQESLGGIRDVIIDDSHAIYLESFRQIDRRLTVARANTAFIGAAPRFVIEALGMILIVALAFVLSLRQGGFATALPLLGALALGSQRLLPMLQQIYLGWTLAMGHRSVVHEVLGLLRLPAEHEDRPLGARPNPLELSKAIRFENVSFTYPGRRSPALHKIDLEIVAGRRVAIIGKTGSGKSTLADLLMGLIDPTSGIISIDGVRLNRDNCRRWQQSIAHVPQAIFLADASIARNIAISVPVAEMDRQRVAEAARKAQLHEFIEGLPEGYDTMVGERGIRLSGGQRQRLGIARAVYKQAAVLILDEATSALDDATEADVMRALEQLGDEGRTIVMIAHRLSTVARSDTVVRLDEGRVVAVGSYDEVVGNSPQPAIM
jgi:ABC-type multidrug transport system fused ATPase/permease subunit